MDSGKKVQIIAWKKAFYQKYFNSGKKLVIGKNPFYIYWVAKLFEACNTDKNITQKDMLKGLSNNYLYWGRLSQINDIPHHAGCCFHCKLQEDCKQVMLERGSMSCPETPEEGFYFNSLDAYSNFLERIREIQKIYYK